MPEGFDWMTYIADAVTRCEGWERVLRKHLAREVRWGKRRRARWQARRDDLYVELGFWQKELRKMRGCAAPE